MLKVKKSDIAQVSNFIDRLVHYDGREFSVDEGKLLMLANELLRTYVYHGQEKVNIID